MTLFLIGYGISAIFSGYYFYCLVQKYKHDITVGGLILRIAISLIPIMNSLFAIGAIDTILKPFLNKPLSPRKYE